MTKVRIVRAEEQEVMVAWREHKAALAEERRGRRCVNFTISMAILAKASQRSAGVASHSHSFSQF